VFTVRVSLGGPTAAPDAPPASDNAPATPNTVTAFVRPFRFEFRLPCDMVEVLPFHPRAQQHINRPTRRLSLLGKLLAVVVAHDKAGGLFFDSPRRREAAGAHGDLTQWEDVHNRVTIAALTYCG
jgi:hypothetical protein